MDLSKEEFSQITTKYDIKNNGKFAYYEFLQCCVLSLKPQGSSVLQRMVVQKLREPVCIRCFFFVTFLQEAVVMGYSAGYSHIPDLRPSTISKVPKQL